MFQNNKNNTYEVKTMNMNFMFISRIYDALISECVLKLSDIATVFGHTLLVKVKARTSNWHICLRMKKDTHVF